MPEGAPIFKGKGQDCQFGIGDGVWPYNGVLMDFQEDPKAEKAILPGRKNGIIGTAYHQPTVEGTVTIVPEIGDEPLAIGDEVLMKGGTEKFIIESAPTRQTTGDWVKITARATYYPDMDL